MTTATSPGPIELGADSRLHALSILIAAQHDLLDDGLTSNRLKIEGLEWLFAIKRRVEKRENWAIWPNPNLEGRKAKCGMCDSIEPSSFDLWMFESLPDEPQDRFYDGCFGSD